MGDKIRYTVSGTIGDHEAFAALAKRMVQDVEASEPDTIAYEWFASDTSFMIHELYRDEDAFLKHFGLRTEAGHLDELMACATITGVDMLTEPKTEPGKAIAAQFGAKQFHGIGGLVR